MEAAGGCKWDGGVNFGRARCGSGGKQEEDINVPPRSAAHDGPASPKCPDPPGFDGSEENQLESGRLRPTPFAVL